MYYIINLFISFIFNFIEPNIYRSTEIINNILNKFCHDPSVLNTHDFEWTKKFRNNWKAIRNEYITYTKKYIVPNYCDLNKVVSSCDSQNKWKALFLRAYNIDTDLSKFFPKTMELINSCPCTLAFFSLLEPGAKLEPHVGIYKGVIRYHLGLIVPEDFDQCFLNIDGKVLNWYEGEDMMFDDTFIHFAENNTNQIRVVLFLDIKRDFHNVFLNMFNSIILNFIKSNDALKQTIENINNSIKEI